MASQAPNNMLPLLYNGLEPLNRNNLIRRSFKPLLKRAGLPQIRFHDLRHTCATLLLAKNVNSKVVSEMLGHATIAITLDPTRTCCPTCRARPHKR